MLFNFRDPFTSRFSKKFVAKISLNASTYLQNVSRPLCEIPAAIKKKDVAAKRLLRKRWILNQLLANGVNTPLD